VTVYLIHELSKLSPKLLRNSQRYRRAKFCKFRELALFTVARSVLYAFNCEKSVTQMAETYSEGFFPSHAAGPTILSVLRELPPLLRGVAYFNKQLSLRGQVDDLG